MKDLKQVCLKIDKTLWAKFRDLINQKGLKIGFAVSSAIGLWIEKNKEDV